MITDVNSEDGLVRRGGVSLFSSGSPCTGGVSFRAGAERTRHGAGAKNAKRASTPRPVDPLFSSNFRFLRAGGVVTRIELEQSTDAASLH